MGLFTSKNQHPEPPSYTLVKNDYEYSHMDVIDKVFNKYILFVNKLGMNQYLNENLRRGLQVLLKIKTGRTANKGTLVLLCALFAEQLAKYGRIKEYYTESNLYGIDE